jgi:hypothetical protein
VVCVCSAPARLSSASRPGVPTTSSGLFFFMASICVQIKTHLIQASITQCIDQTPGCTTVILAFVTRL